jgi:hypothetical protein
VPDVCTDYLPVIGGYAVLLAVLSAVTRKAVWAGIAKIPAKKRAHLSVSPSTLKVLHVSEV